MEADAQRWEAARPRHRVGRRRRGHHQARARQNPPAVGGFDGFVDRDVAAEIVGADDQLPGQLPRLIPQLAISRSRRN
jgi:hypothetical protein